MLLSPEPERYLGNTSWPGRFGEVRSCTRENRDLVTSLRVLYVGGPEVEFSFSSPAWAAVPVDAGTRRVVSGGMHVLYGPDGVLGALRRAVAASG